MEHRYIVIIAGGRGERFWPQSRNACPKHLNPMLGGKPLLLQTVERVRTVAPVANILIITSASQEAALRQVCSELPAENIIVEPMGRDTAPAAALAAAIVRQRDPLAALAVLPADHVIHDTASYVTDIQAAFEAAEREEVLVTIGIRPTEASTGFGYIQRGEAWQKLGGRALYRSKRFVEKPNLETAQAYLAEGSYLWNAGMFFWRASVFESALLAHAPELHKGLEPVRQALAQGGDLKEALANTYANLPKISIDYALMEKSTNVVVLPSSFDWDDLGVWPAVANHLPADASGNVSYGQVVIEQGSGNIVTTETGRIVALLGVEDLIVVNTADATLVCHKSRAQDIKLLLKRIEATEEGRKHL